MLASREQGGLIAQGLAIEALVLLDQKRHGEMAAGKLETRNMEVALTLGADGDQNCVIAAGERAEWTSIADVHIVVEGDALGLHLPDATIDAVLLHLEVGHAVPQKPPGPCLALEDVNFVADAG